VRPFSLTMHHAICYYTAFSFDPHQLAVFDCCLITRASTLSAGTGIQDITPSLITLTFRSTQNQRCNCDPILVTVRLHRILQLDVFVYCPSTRTCHRRVDVRDQDIMPYLHCNFVRPGTSVTIAIQFLPPCVCTASFS
jgi:hypothetical protein